MRLAREGRQLTQADLAASMVLEGAPVTLTAVGHVERGTRSLRFTEAVAIARALDVSLYWLADGRRKAG